MQLHNCTPRKCNKLFVCVVKLLCFLLSGNTWWVQVVGVVAIAQTHLKLAAQPSEKCYALFIVIVVVHHLL